MKNTKAVVLLSGGQDSATVLAFAVERHGPSNVYPLNIAYGQKHQIESEFADRINDRLTNNPIMQLSVSFLSDLGVSALTTGALDVNAKHPYDDELPASFVPNRNATFLTVAHAFAQKIGAPIVYGGMCQEDYSGYPDCREDFIRALEAALNLGAARKVSFKTPLMHLTKAQTFKLADDLGELDLILSETMTCYNGDATKAHPWGLGCGGCPACGVRANGWSEFVESKHHV